MSKLQKNKKRKKNNLRTPRQLSRESTVQAIYHWIITEEEADEVIKQISEVNLENKINPDQELFKKLFLGVLEHYEELKSDVEEYSNRDDKFISPIVTSILILATYEFKYQLATPAVVILNEAIELTKRFSSQEAYRFVNGLLERIAKKNRNDEIN